MSILLKGYKMPKTCMNAGCPVDGKYCLLWWKAGGGSYGRHRECPLVELPDNHGDLIDKDELSRLVGESFEYFLARLGLKCPKAVIPAERSEDADEEH